jgi:hypothetical protein
MKSSVRETGDIRTDLGYLCKVCAVIALARSILKPVSLPELSDQAKLIWTR